MPAAKPKKKTAKKTAAKKPASKKKSATKKSATKKPAPALTPAQALKKLESLGTAQNRKVYARHGVTGPQYGVSFANLRALANSIKRDHPLALQLWNSGNHDARTLAAMIADPASMSPTDLDRWAREADNYIQTDQFAALVAHSPHAISRIEKWRDDKREYNLRAAWSTIACALRDAIDLPQSLLEDALTRIEKTIHTAPNRAREAMNSALIAIGAYRPDLRDKALAAAKRIGPVNIDHGETGCKTPDALTYIPKAAAHHDKKRKRAK